MVTKQTKRSKINNISTYIVTKQKTYTFTKKKKKILRGLIVTPKRILLNIIVSSRLNHTYDRRLYCRENLLT